MNEMQIFDNVQFGRVRVVMKDGKPWFVARDVALALGYEKPQKAVAMHCKYSELFKGSDLGLLEFPPRGMLFIRESDVYRLIMRSNLPEAEHFQDWVCEEVLPSIRRTGSYSGIAMPDFSCPAEAARAWANQYEQRMLAEKQRDIAIRTKAEIGCRREATAMATASVAVRQRDRAMDDLGEGKTWKQVKAIPWLKDFFELTPSAYAQIGKKLVKISAALGFKPKETPSSEYGTVKRYHIKVINKFHEMLLEDKAMLGKYRTAA